MSYQQFVERQKKGLCYKCGGPFHPKHQYPESQLRIMMIEDDEFEEGEMQVMNGEEDEGEEVVELSVMSSMGLSMTRLREVRTLKLRGKVQGVPILLLVDSGVTEFYLP
ncbi:hypothetical protein V8G54_006887 [Vigna mungo]|uniref:Uncharacterized protein n=1 Tax=Vigna mungo TaxID=3915 RepID=A0AAQ3P0V1_VIGMU